MPDAHADVAMRVRALRRKRYKTAKAAAEAAGIPVTTWRSIETGKTCPSLQRLQELAEFFSCRVSYLLGEAELVRAYIPVHDRVLGVGPWIADEFAPWKDPIPNTLSGYRVSDGRPLRFASPWQTVLVDPDCEPRSGDLVLVKLQGEPLAVRRVEFSGDEVGLLELEGESRKRIVKRGQIIRIVKVWGIKF